MKLQEGNNMDNLEETVACTLFKSNYNNNNNSG